MHQTLECSPNSLTLRTSCIGVPSSPGDRNHLRGITALVTKRSKLINCYLWSRDFDSMGQNTQFGLIYLSDTKLPKHWQVSFGSCTNNQTPDPLSLQFCLTHESPVPAPILPPVKPHTTVQQSSACPSWGTVFSGPVWSSSPSPCSQIPMVSHRRISLLVCHPHHITQ